MDARRRSSGVALPIFCLRSSEFRSLRAELRHLTLAKRLELARDANVVFNLSNRCTAERQAMNRQAERVTDAISEMQSLQQLCVSGTLHGLNAHSAVHRDRKHILLETEIRRISRIERHEDGIVLLVILEHRKVNFGIVMAGKANEAAFAGFLGSLECLIAPPGAKIWCTSSMLADLVNLPEVDVVGLQRAE